MLCIMNRRCFVFFLVQLLICNVLAKNTETWNGTVGATVILPCFSNHTGDVFWRYDEKTANKVVFDVVDGKDDLHDQNPEYSGRVQSFSTEFAKGNFSIKLSNLTLSDSGIYTCKTPKSNLNVQLSVKDENKTTTGVKNGDIIGSESSSLLLWCSLLYGLTF